MAEEPIWLVSKGSSNSFLLAKSLISVENFDAVWAIDDKTFDTKKKRPVMHTFFDLVENVGAESSQQKLIDVWTKSWQG